MKKVFDEILRESYKRKDGVYIIGGSGINADHEHIEVWKDGKVVEKSDTIYRYGISGKEFEDTVWNKAEELSKKYKLKIFDGSNVGYSTFSDQYYIGMGSAENSPYVKKGAEWVDYTDKDLDDMDERKPQTCKWAICTAPGEFKIFDRVTKVPWKLKSTNVMEGMSTETFLSFFENHSEETHTGTWDEIKDNDFMVVVNGHLYEKDELTELIEALKDAGLEISDKSVKGKYKAGTKKDWAGDDEEVWVSFSYDKFDENLWDNSERESLEKNLQKAYDVLTCEGVKLPNRWTYYPAADYEVKGYHEFKEGGLEVFISNGQVYLNSPEKINKATGVKVGDLFRYLGNKAYHERDEADVYVVIEVLGAKVKAAKCSDWITTDDSIWGGNSHPYLIPEKYKSALDGDIPKGTEVRTFDLINDRLAPTTYESEIRSLKFALNRAKYHDSKYKNYTLEEGKKMKDNLVEKFFENYNPKKMKESVSGVSPKFRELMIEMSDLLSSAGLDDLADRTYNSLSDTLKDIEIAEDSWR